MDYFDVQTAIEEAKRFIRAAGKVKKHRLLSGTEAKWCEAGADSAATKRASMDLTKALAKMRRG